MTLIPATACLATVLSFYSDCQSKLVEREKSLYWRATCVESGDTLYWYNGSSEFLEDAKSVLISGMKVECQEKDELIVIWSSISKQPKDH